MANFLIVYASKQGQTKKIANYIGEQLKACDNSVDIFDSGSVPAEISPLAYSATIIGGSVHMHHYPQSLKHWVIENANELAQRKSLFFSVCLGILQDDPAVQADEKQIAKTFFEDCGWQPNHWTIFAGALAYSKYNWFTKVLMKYIASKAGFDTRTEKDYEYTDWNKVRSFAQDSLEYGSKGSP